VMVWPLRRRASGMPHHPEHRRAADRARLVHIPAVCAVVSPLEGGKLPTSPFSWPPAPDPGAP
jgi:hypothetical protein